MTALLDHTPPHDLESETALLASLVKEPHRIDVASQIVTGADFYGPDHGELFDAFVALRDAGKPLNDATVAIPAIHKLGLAETWNYNRLLALFKQTAIPVHTKYYASEIRRHSLLRNQINVGTELIRRALEPKADPVANSTWVDGRLASVPLTSEVLPIHDFALEVVDELQKPVGTRGVMSGLVAVDQNVGGMMPGELWTVAARPGCGKTALATQAAHYVAKTGKRVLFVSIEMSGPELAQRTICSLAGVDQRRVRARTLRDDEIHALRDAANDLKGIPLLLWAPHQAGISEIRAAARLNQRAGDFGLLVVDYIQLIRARDERARRNEQIAEITRGLKTLAKEINAPIMALAQLNRDADNQDEPRLKNLADSSSIEKDSDVVMFLHRNQTDRSAVKLIIAKHRHSETGSVNLEWHGHETRFYDPSEYRSHAHRESTFDDWNEAQ